MIALGFREECIGRSEPGYDRVHVPHLEEIAFRPQLPGRNSDSTWSLFAACWRRPFFGVFSLWLVLFGEGRPICQGLPETVVRESSLFQFLLFQTYVGREWKTETAEAALADDTRIAESGIADTATSDKSESGFKSSKIVWQTFAELPLELPSWLIEGLVPAHSLILLYGTRGQGKTFLALDFAASIASGIDCLGRKVHQPGKVGYLLAERPEGLKRRVHGWLKQRQVSEDRIKDIVFTSVDAAALDRRKCRQSIVQSIQDKFSDLADLRLLIIDPMAAHMRGSENDTRDMANFINGVRALSKTLNCSVLLVHHEGKRNFNNMLGARGSSALEAGLDTILYMRPDGDNKEVSELRMTKQRDFVEVAPVWLQFVPERGKPEGCTEEVDLGKFPIVVAAPAREPGQRQIAQELERQMKVELPKIALACINDGDDIVRSKGVQTVSHKMIMKRLEVWAKERSAPADFPADARVRACLKALVKEGILFVQRGGSNAQLYSLERPAG